MVRAEITAHALVGAAARVGELACVRHMSHRRQCLPYRCPAVRMYDGSSACADGVTCGPCRVWRDALWHRKLSPGVSMRHDAQFRQHRTRTVANVYFHPVVPVRAWAGVTVLCVRNPMLTCPLQQVCDLSPCHMHKLVSDVHWLPSPANCCQR
eukprot:jgi/Ulvmu1/7094/UM033_0155.1